MVEECRQVAAFCNSGFTKHLHWVASVVHLISYYVVACMAATSKSQGYQLTASPLVPKQELVYHGWHSQQTLLWPELQCLHFSYCLTGYLRTNFLSYFSSAGSTCRSDNVRYMQSTPAMSCNSNETARSSN